MAKITHKQALTASGAATTAGFVWMVATMGWSEANAVGLFVGGMVILIEVIRATPRPRKKKRLVDANEPRKIKKETFH